MGYGDGDGWITRYGNGLWGMPTFLFIFVSFYFLKWLSRQAVRQAGKLESLCIYYLSIILYI